MICAPEVLWNIIVGLLMLLTSSLVLLIMLLIMGGMNIGKQKGPNKYYYECAVNFLPERW